jgi:hypothetical protein
VHHPKVLDAVEDLRLFRLRQDQGFMKAAE